MTAQTTAIPRTRPAGAGGRGQSGAGGRGQSGAAGGRFDGLRWAVTDSLTVANRDLIHWVRGPWRILASLLWPIMFVVLFGYVFGSAMIVPGGGDYREFLMPGLFAQTMMFGIGETATAVVADAQRGVNDRFRSMPMSQVGVVAGRSLADMVNAVLGLAVLIGCGLVVGWRWHNSLGQALLAIGLLLLLRFALIWAGIYLGLVMPNEETMGAVWGLLFPITMIANTFAPPELMPGWLGAIAEWNPLSATVTATRELFGNPGLGGGGWATQNADLLSILWPVALVAVFLPLAVRRYRRLSR